MATTDTDLLLLKRFAEYHDTGAFAEIVRRYAAMVFAACRRIVRDSALAEDVSQETFFRLMKRPDAVSQSLGAWLHQAATNLAVDAVRSDSARRRREHVYAVESTAERFDSGPPRQDQQVETWSEISPLIDEVLGEMPAEARELLVAHFLCGRPQNELAVEAGTSAATMCRRIRAAVEGLQSRLRERGMTVPPLALLGLLHDNALAAAPRTLLSQLGKMTMVSGIRRWFHPRATASGQPTVLWTAATIACTSVVMGAICTFLYAKAVPTRWIPSPTAQLMIDDHTR